MKIRNRILAAAAFVLATVLPGQALDLIPSGKTKTLVAYFSATGNTRAVAAQIAELTGADLYEIEPARPYASNPYDDSELIQNEAYNDLRPEVANLPDAETIAMYDTIYVGSPLWWHQPAMVVCTFLEAYDLGGKVVVPFITYGGTTYLNEGMQKLFKCTPNSIHVPAELPEDLDPDNIREPQADDAGIDVPNRPSQVDAWLERMGLWPPKDSSGIDGVTAPLQDITVTNTPDGISVTLDTPGVLAVYDTNGRAALTAQVNGNPSIQLDKGMYIVSVQSDNLHSAKKIIVN